MTRPGLLFRPLAPDDLGELSDLWVETWSDTYPGIDFEARRSWLMERLLSLARRGVRVELAFEGADMGLAGFVTVDPVDGYLDQLAVARARRGSGVAARVLDHAKALSPGRLTLDVNQANPRAVRFYEREGFVRTGEGISEASGRPLYRYAWRRAGMD